MKTIGRTMASNMFSQAFTSTRRSYDEGLRKYMLNIYTIMSVGLMISAIVAYGFISVPALAELIFNIAPNGMLLGYTGLGYLILLAPLGIAMYFFFGIGRMSIEKAQMLFWVYAAVTGASLASLGFIYTGASIAKTFLITAGTFGSMSIYGYSTKRDLTSMASFLRMGLFGIIIASAVNIFMHSTAVDFAVSFLGVFIFMGLTAWDTQRLKDMYYSVGGGEFAQKYAIVGAFTLYLDFLNLFLMMIRFFGDRRQ